MNTSTYTNINQSKNKYKNEVPFKWDGTSLGVINERQILNKYVLGKLQYWDLQLDIYRIICIIRTCRDYTPCIIDELKPLFGLIKLGTHYVKYGSIYVILIRSRINEIGKNIISETFLNELVPCEMEDKDIYEDVYDKKLNKDVENKIKEIYVFRDILCLGKSNDNSIILRRNMTEGKIFPVSLMDSSIKLDKMTDIYVSTFIPEIIFKRWLNDDSPSRILYKMLKVRGESNFVLRLYNIKTKINEILMRISGGVYINLSDVIISRISNKLQFHIEKMQN